MQATSTSRIRDYLADAQRIDMSDISDDTALFSSGLIDSFAMIDLVSFIEQDLGIAMKPADITLDNLDTLGRIAAFVDKRT